MENAKKLVFIDIDGTLNVPGEKITENVFSALSKAQSNGHRLFISTGRLRSSLSESVKSFSFDGGIFSAGRQLVICNEVIYESYMNPTIVQRIQNILYEKKAKQSIETKDGAYVDWYGEDWNLSYEEWIHLVRVIGGTRIHNINNYEGNSTFKIVFIVDSEDIAEQIADSVGELSKNISLPNLNTVIFGHLIKELPVVIGEISDSTIDKGTGLAKICRYYNASLSDTVAFGDSMNDAPMIKKAGIGVAMGNSESSLIALADMTCKSVFEDGIVDGFKRLRLI